MTRPVAEWVALYQAGQSLRAIGAEYGCCHKTVLYTFRQHGIPTRSRNQAKPPSRLTWELDYCQNCDREARINPTTGWCSSCTFAGRNHPNLRTPIDRIGPERANAPALVATSTREATMHHHTPIGCG